MELKENATLENNLAVLYRILALLAVVFIFVPPFNPARLSVLVGRTQSLLSSGLSFSRLTAEFIRPVAQGWITGRSLQLLYYGALGGWIGIGFSGLGAAFGLGELKLKRLGLFMSLGGSLVSSLSMLLFIPVFQSFSLSSNLPRVQPQFPLGFGIIQGINLLVILLAFYQLIRLPRPLPDARYEMKPKYQLFLLMLPFIALTFVFAYLPLWGWAVSFFDYQSGFALTPERFVGFKWFTYLFENSATRNDIFRVLRNTLAMSGLGLATSWMAMAFAIMLTEIKQTGYRRLIQTLTTIPNFISWVLIYTFALAMFSTEGFINTLLLDLGFIQSPIAFLQSPDNTWIKMLLWGMWKGLGWSAIIYIAAITGIDPQLYEAATVDGAGRFRKIWYITIPSLLPTYFVLLLLSIAGILNNGMEQYFVFKNAMNKGSIEVLDLYVYVLGLGSGGASNIALATVVGFMKSVISISLLFIANRASKIIRGHSIV